MFAGKGINDIADYEEAIIQGLNRKPVIIGHSFGGLLTMILAGRGLASASIAISPAPFRGVLPDCFQHQKARLSGIVIHLSNQALVHK